MIKRNKKVEQKVRGMTVAMVRLCFFLVWPALFSTAFTGIKQVVETVDKGELLPWNPFVATLLALAVFTMVFGRFFCGFACAFGTWGDFVYFLSSRWQKKRKKRLFHCFRKVEFVFRYGKYMVLAGVLLLCVLGMGGQVDFHSPFRAFSRLHRLTMPDSWIGLFLFMLITLGMALEPRFFCRFLCPMGAVFSLLPILPFSVIKKNTGQCISGCQGCQNVCPAHLELPTDVRGDHSLTGECFSCGKCMKQCPRQSAHDGLPAVLRWPFFFLKALLLAVLAFSI